MGLVGVFLAPSLGYLVRIMLLALLLWTAHTAASLQCPKFSCTALDSNVCARRTSPFQLDLAVDACSTDRECHILSVFSWLNSGDTNSLYYCQKKPTVSSSTNFSGPRYCVKRSADRDFMGGLTFVTCTMDSDCLLDDGTYTSGACVCSVRGNGKGICNPDISSTTFQGFWDACGTDNTIDSKEAYDYWMYYIQMWVFTQSDLECAKNLYELQNLITLHDLYSNVGATLAAGLVTLLV